ncbi:MULTISPECIES: hypothetical protein [unclassified Synechocystis]|uniref:hypothetical protein n=1 Tax=unclassified Synechocystis TaxID=2640012 RepID=UPI00048DC9B9|nr:MULTISPECIES: hypothetical protein [unclassified Synechocystis]AIE73735.1 hypothetical protein D082_12070 [Synechocystis sp. PCC 6714]MCT0252434.1 hypothetical protein [Synechocystis sp. CS-94]
MFTKFNQVLLASGLVISSAVMLSPAAFAETANSGVVTTGTPAAFAAINVTGSGNSFPVTYNTAITDQTIATVAYSTNVIGDWNIKAQGGNTGQEGELVASGLTATIPYQVRIGSGSYVTPVASADLAGATPLISGEILASDTGVLDVTGAQLQIKILAADTKVPTATGAGSAYSETVTLVFTSGQ